MRTQHLNGPYLMVTLSKPDTPEGLFHTLLALKKCAETDPGLLVYTHDVRKRIIIAGLGERHIQGIITRLIEEFHLEIQAETPQILYKETIKSVVKSEGSFVRQASSLCRYGHCWIAMEPAVRGAGYEFINQITGEAVIPSKYIESVEEGLQRAMTSGVLGNFPVVDFRVTLYDGSTHRTDSSSMSYIIAAAMAFKNGLKRAAPVLLEPIMNLTVVVEESLLSLARNEIHAMNGRNVSVEYEGEMVILTADVPLREWWNSGKSDTLKKGHPSLAFAYYDEVPGDVQATLVAEANLRDVSYTDLFFWSKWGEKNEEYYLKQFVDDLWEGE
ncbi:hypothetical protein ACE6ED_01145 [Paenibacillus sp. CN-4]|uniref:hypothetical protein n=1 Tax=Paenibacillus nanchangensis TaxID=3348343 RepID=UPI00397A8E33